jgi:hypothetical protein
MEAAVNRSLVLLALLAPVALGCGGASHAAAQQGAPTPAATVGAGTAASDDPQGLIPPGLGTLRQDDIALQLELEGVQVKAIPLDESIIRTLSPDSYRALHNLKEGRASQIAATGRRYGSNQPDLWYVSFFAVAPEARFSPQEFIITNNGRDFRPLDVLPLTPGWGEQRLKVREVQAALYLFDPSLDTSQPLTVRVETAQNTEWPNVLRRVQREQALIRSRSSQKP